MNHSEAVAALKAVLCDPDGKCCIDGSEADRQQVDAAIAALGGVEALTEAERMALEGVMANAEHEGYDTDDACPDIDDDEDAYWAWNTYHGLRKLLPAPPSKEG